MNAIKKKSACPIYFALNIFGDKWTFLIVRDLMFKGKRYYGEFLTSEEQIATNTLAHRLQLLEQQGIVSKKQDLQHKQKSIYQLTNKGIDLVPLLIEMILWSAKYDKKTAVDPIFVAQSKKDKSALVSKISNQLLSQLKES
jgi:DNA-binding HxlR family transcriptional regulator